MQSIVEKALLVKLYYKNSESAIAALRAYRYMKGMRDSKGPITSSALNKNFETKKFEATGSLPSHPRSCVGRPSTGAAVATTVEQTVSYKLIYITKINISVRMLKTFVLKT
ncbi:hypothetical protein JTE90_011167 [Oedothorax gibbosus]|uniref:DUF4817 domain-containing protein n=1 Tax=Oedothorax gibbosus TaxID=931172 RepID=A0AAV6U6S0_9ARAC|nr:hypothetical protein JTE90_011167 [Oedothorax gibbosus]